MSLRKENKRMYQIWAHMKYRCNTPSHKQYGDYGGRGISYDPSWNVFVNFYEWSINNGYEEDLTLDRIDNNLDYSPLNCRWVTKAFQNRNRRYNYSITIDGETKTAQEWCKIHNLNYNTFFTRVNLYNWDVIKAITTPTMLRKNPVGFNTEIKDIPR